MTQPMVVTNLRIPQIDYLQIKAAAADAGMSINEYINFTAKIVSKNRALSPAVSQKKSRYSAAWKIINSHYMKKPMGLSKEDEAIYSV